MRATERLLAAGRALAMRSNEEIARIVASVRAWDRFFRMRLAVLATWSLLALVAIGVARGGGELPSNPLQAYASLGNPTLGWALLIHNRSKQPWREVAIELEGGQVFLREAIAPDEKLVLSPWQFAGAEGEGAPEEPPREVVLRVGGQLVRLPLSQKKGD